MPRHFANYPAAREAPDLTYKWEADKNPVLRGYPLVVASALITSSGTLSKFIWSNAGFGKLHNIPELDKEQWRFQPTVVPLRDGATAQSVAGEPDETLLAFAPALLQAQAPDRAGRFYSAADYHALYRSGEATPSQVAEALLPLVQRGQDPPSPYELAWVASNVDDVRAAARASTERWAAGKPLGILDGVPIGVKCDLDVKGYVSSVGMKVDPAHPFFRPAQTTAWPVQKLQQAGVVVIGHNNMHEIGMDTTGCNPATGTPINWYNKSYYPGGSSSGGCSSLGAGLVPIAIGTDAGGSARIPPSFNGMYGLKPSHDRTMVWKSTMTVTGPMAATVADLTIAYRVMAQPDADDPIQGRFALSVPPTPSSKKTIGVVKDWVGRAAPAVLEHFNKVVEHFGAKPDYEVIEIQLPYLREGQLAHAATCLTEAVEHAKARAPGDKNWLRLLTYPNRTVLAAGQHTSAFDYIRYGQVRQALMRHLAFLFAKHPGLLVLTPTTPLAGWKVTAGDGAYGFSDANLSILNMMYVWVANTSGCPAVTCPMGYAEPEQGEGRVPLGVQAMAEWGAEEQLLAWAAEAEAYLHDVYPGGRLRPEGWTDVVGLAREAAKRDAEGVANGS